MSTTTATTTRAAAGAAVPRNTTGVEDSFGARLKRFVTVFDDRFEDMRNAGDWKRIALRDTSAGLLVAMMAIPMAMGFAIASGLRPEHGIMAGALAGLVGALFGGSKFNVYGPVAALIPVIAGIMTKYRTPEDAFAGHGFIVAVCVLSGVLLVVVALAGWGRIGNWVPHSVVVGFSVGIAVTIAQTQIGEILGLKLPYTGGFIEKLGLIAENIGKTNIAAVLIGLGTFAVTRTLLNISIFIPAPLIALGASTIAAATVFASNNLALIKTNYGEIPTNFLTVTPPSLPSMESSVILDLLFYAAAFAFVCGFESLLAARMADRLADNKGTPYDPNKEFWGQGLIQTFIPLMNGMPLSGALARTATNIKVGALTPLAGIMKCVFKLALVFFLADYLEMVPMACIAGILLWVAVNMVKPKEISQVWNHNWLHAGLMVYTGVMVVLTSFLTGVLSAMFIFAVLHRKFDTPGAELGH